MLVNGEKLNDEIRPTKGDWQSITLSKGGEITLSSGLNKISIIGDIPDIPSVEHLKLSKRSSEATISSSAYDKYKDDIKTTNQKKKA